MRAIAIIYNPNAGQNSKSILDKTIFQLEYHHAKYVLIPTEHAGHGEDIARNVSLDDDVEIIVAAGGDGTINEIMNGMAHSNKLFGIIPLGTANVLAKEIGLQISPKHIAEVLISDKSALLYPSIINGKYFSLMASIGYDALSVNNVSLNFKKKWGEVAYLSSIKQLIVSEPIEYFVEINTKKYRCYGAIITNGKYYAGKYVCAPDASVFDNKLKAILFMKKGPWAALKYFLAIVFNRLDHCKDVQYIDVQHVKISSEIQAPIQIDGDHYGDLPVLIKTSNKPIQLLVP
jgi:diacylglycerol kinase (ATP)